MTRTHKDIETILQSVQFGMMVVGEDRRIRMVNSAALRMMGFKSEEDIVGEICHQRVCPAEMGKCPILDLGQRVDFSEKTLLCSDGTGLPILKSVSKINLEGETVLLETFLDISERKKAEKEIDEANAFIQTVIESVAEPLMVVGLDYQVKMMNTAAREFWQKENRDSDKPVCYKVLHHHDSPCSSIDGHQCPLEQVQRTGKPVIAVHEHTLPDGERRFYEILASPLKDSSGALEAIIETSRDITERVIIERQKSDFLAMVTHDLKSPLTVILGYAEMIMDLKGNAIDSDTADMVKGILQSGRKIHDLVEDFLTISRLEKGDAAIHLSVTDVSSLLEETAAEAETVAASAGLSLRLEIGALPNALLDSHLVRRAVWNMLDNAVKYTPAGGNITLSARTEQRGVENFLVISVTDTGIGISQNERERIFDKYYRSPKAAGIKGTGLGLAIVKAVADAHSGKVELESEPWKGSTFSLILPLQAN